MTLRRIATLGLPILPEDRVSGLDRVLAPNSGARPEAIIYRQRLKGNFDRRAMAGRRDRWPGPALSPAEGGRPSSGARTLAVGPGDVPLWKDR